MHANTRFFILIIISIFTNRTISSPYLQFTKKEVPHSYTQNPSTYAPSMIAQGKTIYKQIINGTINLPYLKKNLGEYVRSIAALMFYLFSKAVEKKQGFSSGSILIKDPGFKIYNFLYSYVQIKWKGSMVKEVLVDIKGKGAYPRKSTHFNSFYLHMGIAKKDFLGVIKKSAPFIHYGIDMPKNITFPAKKRHILFGRVALTPPLTFIKMEKHGLGKTDVLKHTFSLGESQIKKAVNKTAHKLKELGFKKVGELKSLLNQLASATSDDTPDARRERIPVSTLSDFLGVMLSKESPLKRNQINIGKIKALGIKHMINMLDSYAASNKGTPAWRAWPRKLAQQLRNTYDHVDLRFGKEVILTPEAELKN